MQITEIVTSVRATGTVSTDYDRASFTIGLETRAKTKKEAMVALKAKVAALAAFVDAEIDDAIEPNGRLSSYGDQQLWSEAQRGKKPVREGHLAWYRLTFWTDRMDEIDEIQDKLASYEDGSVTPVSYELKDERPLQKSAIQAAYDNAMRQFHDECTVLGKDPAAYEVRSWNVNYQQNRGAQRGVMMAKTLAASAPEAPAIENDGGKASVSVNLILNFAEKSGIPIR